MRGACHLGFAGILCGKAGEEGRGWSREEPVLGGSGVTPRTFVARASPGPAFVCARTHRHAFEDAAGAALILRSQSRRGHARAARGRSEVRVGARVGAREQEASVPCYA